MPKVRWDLRVEEDLAEWTEAYAAERGVSRTLVVELALKELRGLAKGGVPDVPEVPDVPVFRRRAGRVRRCFQCRHGDCITRVFLTPQDPPDLVPQCPEHGPMVRAENHPYFGQPTPV